MPKSAASTKSLDDILSAFEKKTGLKVGTPEQVTGYSTGNIALDWQSGVGGIPRGRITELYGYESSGKTTTALQTAALVQRRIKDSDSDERIFYLDFEHALDVGYAAQLGIDFDHRSFTPLQPRNLEQGGEAALDLVQTGQVPLIVFDSVAAMAPRRKEEGGFDQATIQLHRAKLISALCQSMIDMLHSTQCAAIFINHKQESVEMTGRPGMPPKVTTPGGRGLKFYASLRLEFDVAGGVKEQIEDAFSTEDTNTLVGNRVFVKCVKNKVGVPGRVVELRNRFGRGFDNNWTVLQIMLAHGDFKKSGSWINLSPDVSQTGDKQQLQGEAQVLAAMDADPAWAARLGDKAKRIVADSVGTP